MNASEQLSDVLEGRVAYCDAALAIQSWVAFFVYQASENILKLPKEKRRSAIDKAPEGLRPMIEAEITRLWRYYRGSA